MSALPPFPESDTHSLETVLDWLRWSASRMTEAGVYFGHGTDNAWDEAIFLLSSALHQPWEKIDQIAGARLTHSEKDAVYTLMQRRIDQRIPAPYLTGVAWFAGYPYKVTPEVLIPRSPIAELIAAEFQPWLTVTPQRILDLCAGSGCIGIACAHQFAEAEVVLSDISTAALAVAQQNIAFHQLDERVQAIESDGLAALRGQCFDLIVANPPYVDAEDYAAMPAEYHAEPVLGLVSGEDGLDFTRALLAGAAEFLTENGLLVVEVGNSWPALEEAYPRVAFTWPELENGGHGVFVLTRAQLLELV